MFETRSPQHAAVSLLLRFSSTIINKVAKATINSDSFLTMDSINISQKTAKCLSNLNSVPKEGLGKVCKFFLQSLVKGTSNVQIDEGLDDTLCAISTILLESARTRSNEEQLKSVLVEHGVNSEIANILTVLYGEHKDTLIQHIDTTGISAPKIVGVDWRLDHSIKSKNTGRENVPMFFVALRVNDRGVLRDINMVSSLQEMQDLLSKVRDAVKQVDRVLNMPEH